MTDDVLLPAEAAGMTRAPAELERALDRVVAAARAHLDAIRAAEGQVDDDAVWNAYVALNNASHEYDEALNDAYGEVTPWDLEAISPEEAQSGRGGVTELTSSDGLNLPADDPHPAVISVRQRRDYRVPSVSALIALAEAGRASIAESDDAEPITSVADAVLELLQVGDGSLGMLDVHELDPLDGVVIVAEVAQPLVPADDDTDAEGPFRLAGGDRAVGRLDERTVPDDLED